jgi:hypothetical protein
VGVVRGLGTVGGGLVQEGAVIDGAVVAGFVVVGAGTGFRRGAGAATAGVLVLAGTSAPGRSFFGTTRAAAGALAGFQAAVE